MDRRLTLTSWIQSGFPGSPLDRETAPFGELVDRAREALASDSGEPISPNLRRTFSALLWQFRAFAAEQADCSGSTIGFRGVPILRSGCTECFAPLAGGGDSASGRGTCFCHTGSRGRCSAGARESARNGRVSIEEGVRGLTVSIRLSDLRFNGTF
jgi:hypothetical protein